MPQETNHHTLSNWDNSWCYIGILLSKGRVVLCMIIPCWLRPDLRYGHIPADQSGDNLYKPCRPDHPQGWTKCFTCDNRHIGYCIHPNGIGVKVSVTCWNRINKLLKTGIVNIPVIPKQTHMLKVPVMIWETIRILEGWQMYPA